LFWERLFCRIYSFVYFFPWHQTLRQIRDTCSWILLHRIILRFSFVFGLARDIFNPNNCNNLFRFMLTSASVPQPIHCGLNNIKY
jgi:hypothetical protein